MHGRRAGGAGGAGGPRGELSRGGYGEWRGDGEVGRLGRVQGGVVTLQREAVWRGGARPTGYEPRAWLPTGLGLGSGVGLGRVELCNDWDEAMWQREVECAGREHTVIAGGVCIAPGVGGSKYGPVRTAQAACARANGRVRCAPARTRRAARTRRQGEPSGASRRGRDAREARGGGSLVAVGCRGRVWGAAGRDARDGGR